MNMVGSCHIPLVVMSKYRGWKMTVRLAQGLPYGLILGVAFLIRHGIVLNFGKGGSSKPALESPSVPLRSITGRSTKSERKATSCKATKGIRKPLQRHLEQRCDNTGTLLCGGTTVTRERAGGIGRTHYSPKGE